MRFTTILFAGVFAVLASAQSTTTQATTTSVDAAQSSQQAAQDAMIKCIKACQDGDVACTSKCIAVPNPDTSQVNATNNCVAACPKGSGSATDNLNYQNCVDGCIGQYYYTTSGTPKATGGSGSGSGSGSGAGTGGGTGTGSGPSATGSAASGSASGSGSATGAAASASTSKAAADVVQVAGSAAAGVLGFLAALLAI